MNLYDEHEVSEAMLLDEYIDALQKNIRAQPPAELDQALSDCVKEITSSLNMPYDADKLSAIWKKSLREAKAIQKQQDRTTLVTTEAAPASTQKRLLQFGSMGLAKLWGQRLDKDLIRVGLTLSLFVFAWVINVA